MNLIRLGAVCGVLLVLAVGQETTIRIPLSSEEIDEVTFDASRVSAADVGRWILLSEYGPHSEADVGIELCGWVPPSESARIKKNSPCARYARRASQAH